VSRASFSRNGPRSGLSSADPEFGFISGSGGGFLGENLDLEGDGEGTRFGSGEGGLALPGSDLWDWLCVGVSGTEILGDAISGGVLMETKPGIVTVDVRCSERK
jgi:hypothetical protein